MLDEKNPQMSEENITNLKILLAEDDASMRRFLEITLRRAGYEVTSAEDGLAAMKNALSETFDVVVADAVMPNMTGHDLCRMLRQNPNYASTPLIILSGLEHEISANIEHDCADVYLTKNASLKEEITENIARVVLQKTK